MFFMKYDNCNNEKLIKNAIYVSSAVSIILFIMKYFNFNLTHSHAICASALDSFVDMISSMITLLTVSLVFLKNNKTFSKGFDKLASLFCFFQSVLVILFSLNLVKESLANIFNRHSEAQHLLGSIPVIIISIIINVALVAYQKKIFNQTGSMIVETNMIHFSSDIISHLALLFGVILMRFTRFVWIDSIVAIILVLYIFASIFKVVKQSVFSILDLNFREKAKRIKDVLLLDNYMFDDVFVYFSGRKYLVEIHNYNGEDRNIVKNKILSMDNLPFALSSCGCHLYSVEFDILFVNK